MRASLCLAALILLSLSGPLSSQEVGAIQGVVRDTRGRPLADAEILVVPRMARARTDSSGAFVVSGLPSGPYEVSARHLGYMSRLQKVRLSNDTVTLALVLRELVPVLAPVVSTGKRSGVSGFTVDAAYKGIPGIEIVLVPGQKHVQTDSTGAFSFDAKPGKYMMQVQGTADYGSQFASVTVPDDGGKEVLLQLSRGRPQRRADAMMMSELGDRIARRNPVWSALVTRDDINKSGMKELSEVVNHGAVAQVDPSCNAMMFGQGQIPIWSITADEIEFVEIYAKKPPRNTSGRPSRQRRPMPGDDCPAQVIVWPRR